ncbi:MAG: transglutaminase domain-containing protein [Alphaproteobacteria bacterium]|nr:transglutaminase domain-containing protein [Alphaproteobacteria bacterium]
MDDLRVNNESTLINPKGVTSDIVTAVVDCYQRNVGTVPQSLLRIVADCDDENIAYNIFVWISDNIRYKKDPDGQQWVKTPARLIYDGCGDCKSYSILICSVLTIMGVKNKFRFVSYDGTTNYSHVYPVAIIDGEQIPVDVVAWQQKGVEFGNEVEYTNKKDIMNTTKISELSGFDANMKGTTSILRDNISAAKLVAESYKLVGIVTANASLYNKFTILSLLIDKYQSDLRMFKFACYQWLTLFDFSDWHVLSQNAVDVYVSEVAGRVSAMNNSSTSVSELLLDNSIYKENWQMLEDDIFPVLNRYKDDCDNVKLGQDLLQMCMCGLYLFIPDNYLTKAQRSKKANQSAFVEKMISTSAFTPTAALNYIYAGFVSFTKTTPDMVFNAMFGTRLQIPFITDAITGEFERSQISGEDDGDCYTIEYNDQYDEFGAVQKAEVVNTKNISQDDLKGWIDTGATWFEKIFSAITGRKSNGNGVIPMYTDNSGSFSGWLILAGLGLGAFFLLRKGRRRK